MKRSGKSGFTLLELLVVVIIVGILATIAIPAFLDAMENARSAEARSFLDTVKTAEEAYYQEHLIYTGTFSDLVVDQPSATSTKHYFKYTLASAGSTQFVGTATRKTTGDTGKSPNFSTAYTITLDQNGNLTGGPP